MPPAKTTLRHLRVDRFHRAEVYKSKGRKTSPSVPERPDSKSHGNGLLKEVQTIKDDYKALTEAWEGNEEIQAKGISIELESAPAIGIDIARLEENGWSLLNERVSNKAGQIVTFQTWFVPDGKLEILASIVGDYLSKTQKITQGKDKGKLLPKYRPLVDAIERIGKAAAEQFWTEIDEKFPNDGTLWFEVWLRRGNSEQDRIAILEQFRKLSAGTGLRVGKGQINLPEHTIVAAFGKGDSFSKDLALLSCIAELRRGRDYADFFEALRPEEQAEWAKELSERMDQRTDGAPYVSVLDTGTNRAHPLLERHFAQEDNHTINTAWSSADDDNHGTMMAGFCLFGDLTLALSTKDKIPMPVNLEAVKIVPPPAERGTDEKLAGAYTAQGVAVAETNAPRRRRVWCVATTMKQSKDPIPTSWSAQIDALACGLDNEGDVRRLLCLSAGNIPQTDWIDYPKSNYKYSIENPAQSWNALSVGAFTELNTVKLENSYNPIAASGGLGPASSTSLLWDSRWPNKPDVVFEGGNAGHQSANNSTLQLPELLLLSTHANFNEGVLGVMGGTSPAAAFAARFAGQIMAEYPDLSPESVRGLIVHSAEWTTAMKDSIPQKLQADKRERANFLLRTVGYGVPSLRRAMECVLSRATLIAQCELQPFKMEKDEVVFNNMHIHRLPWPVKELSKFSRENVRMRVTLSYFIEPNPGSRGTSHFRYPSCALRFKVSSPGQTEDDLVAQVSKLAAEEFEKQNRVHVGGTTDGWMLGQACFRGSVHSDIWEGTAADLMSMQHIAISPITGWWRTRPSHEKWNSKINYSLIITIEGDNTKIDLYNEIKNQVVVPIPIDT